MTDRNIHNQRTAAARAGFSERTARRFDADLTLPSQRQPKRVRTVADPLDGVWETLLLPILKQDSSVQAITLLRHLCSVASEIPSSCDSCRMATLFGGSIRFSTAAFRSSEYPMSLS